MKTIKVLSFAAIFALIAWLPAERFYWDMQVRRLCALDGGVKVYETVELPADQFDSSGRVHIRGDKILVGSGYTVRTQQHYYKKGDVPVGNNSSMLQFRVAIVRNSDGKILGESIVYQRAGGGFLDQLADAPSHFECPSIAESDEYAVMKRVFIATEKKE